MSTEFFQKGYSRLPQGYSKYRTEYLNSFRKGSYCPASEENELNSRTHQIITENKQKELDFTKKAENPEIMSSMGEATGLWLNQRTTN